MFEKENGKIGTSAGEVVGDDVFGEVLTVRWSDGETCKILRKNLRLAPKPGEKLVIDGNLCELMGYGDGKQRSKAVQEKEGDGVGALLRPVSAYEQQVEVNKKENRQVLASLGLANPEPLIPKKTAPPKDSDSDSDYDYEADKLFASTDDEDEEVTKATKKTACKKKRQKRQRAEKPQTACKKKQKRTNKKNDETSPTSQTSPQKSTSPTWKRCRAPPLVAKQDRALTRWFKDNCPASHKGSYAVVHRSAKRYVQQHAAGNKDINKRKIVDEVLASAPANLEFPPGESLFISRMYTCLFLWMYL